MNCIFTLSDLNTSLENLGNVLFERLSQFSESINEPQETKINILKEISKIGDSQQIDSSKIDQAMSVFDPESENYVGVDSIFSNPDGTIREEFPSIEEIRNAMIAWTIQPNPGQEDTSSAKLNNQEKSSQIVVEDPLGMAYGRALKAKIRAQQHANSVGVHSILFNNNGIINGTHELNNAIQLQQEELLQNILKYIASKVSNFEYSDTRMYENGQYTGIIEKLQEKYGNLFKFDFNELNALYNNNELNTLDAYSSWVILNNFDTILKETFGKAISIDGNKTKYYIGKYSVAGGSNVYTTWRTNEEIDLSKEINNITQAIITSLPYYTADSAVPTSKNLKFNEFIYIISKIKELPLHAKQDVDISGILNYLSKETQNIIKYPVEALLEKNPKTYLSYIIQAMQDEMFNTFNENIQSLLQGKTIEELNTIYNKKDKNEEDYKVLNAMLEILSNTNFQKKYFSKEIQNLLKEKSLFDLINLLRDNPQKYLPAIIEILNNKIIFTKVKESVEEKYFASLDRDLINTIYQGIFNGNNPESLLSIQGLRKGFLGTNYYAFITQTIDSMYKSNFLQYFRDPEGQIYVRPMYDQSLYNIEQTIRTSINNFNSTLIKTNVQHINETYNPTDNSDKQFNLLNTNFLGTFTLNLDGNEYECSVVSKQLQNGGVHKMFKVNSKGNPVTDQNILNMINELIKNNLSLPDTVTYTINDFYKGSLTVSVNLINGTVTYSVNGQDYSFQDKKDYDSLSGVIQDILKQNFDINPDYLEAYLNRISESVYIDRYGLATGALMTLVSRVIANQYIQEKYIKNSQIVGIEGTDGRLRIDSTLNKRKKLKSIYKGTLYTVTLNSSTGEINFLGSSDTPIIKNLAEANAQITGRLTSSQILDGENNALASSTLSRLVNSLPYQVVKQALAENSAAKNFLLWNPGVYKGVSQLKELKDNKNNSSKSHISFSNKEMENSLIFIDFVSGLTNVESTKTPLSGGIVAFYPSENSDKTFAGRLMIDLNAVKINGTDLFTLIRQDLNNINLIYPIIREQLGNFYNKALENINKEWKRVQDLCDEYIINYNNEALKYGLPTIIRKDIKYGDWSTIKQLVEIERSRSGNENLTELDFVRNLVTKHNNENPFDIITLRDQIHYVADKKTGELQVNNSLIANIERFRSDKAFKDFMDSQDLQLLKTLLKDRLNPDATPEIVSLVGKEWIDPYTNKVILGKTIDGKIIKHVEQLQTIQDIVLNPLIKAYNGLNYLFTQEYMNSSVGAYYAHPNKKHTVILPEIMSLEQQYAIQMNDEAARKLAQDKRNVDFTAAMHAFQKGLIQGIPDEINVAIIPNSNDEYETIIGEKYKMDADDGACYTNPFYQILQNNSLCGARVGLIKKTFTHYYDEQTGTAGIFKDAEFPLTNEWIRRSLRYQNLMRNMTDRVWRNEDGSLAEVDILRDFKGNLIEFINPNCTRQGQLFYRDSTTGKYYAFWIRNGQTPNSYIRTVQEVDENGVAIGEMEDQPEIIVDTNFKLWNLLGGAYSMAIKPGSNKLTYDESSINMVVKIMNNTHSLNDGRTVPDVIRTQEDVWQPLKHSDIHLMPTVGAVKMGIANVNTKEAYEKANPEGVNFFRIKTDQMGVQLDKEHHADGEDLSIMTQVLSACASRGYTPEQTRNLYNALASLARAGIKPYLKKFEEFFEISSRKGATSEELKKAKQNFENVLLNTLVKALATSKNNSATLSIVTSELIQAAKEGKNIQFAKLKVPLSDPSVMRKLHSIISVALTSAAIKIKIDGSLNMLCPSNEIIKVYGEKLGNQYLNTSEIEQAQIIADADPNSELINDISRIKLGRHYKVVEKGGDPNYPKILFIKFPEDYYQLKRDLQKYESIKEQFAPMTWYTPKQHTMIEPSIIRNEINNTVGIKRKIQKLKELTGLDIENFASKNLLFEYISKNLPKLSKDSIKQELYGDKNVSDKELGRFTDIFKGGKLTITQAAESIEGELLGTSLETNTQTIRNAIIQLLQEATTSNDVYYYSEYDKLEQALQEYENYYDQEEQEIISSNIPHYFEGGRELGAYNLTFSGRVSSLNESVIIITGNPSTTAREALEIRGIDALRHPDANGMHFGNPFTHLESEVKAGRASVLTKNVRQAVEYFEQWLKGEAFQDIEPERRQWIINQINSGVLAGKPIVYYTNTIKDSDGFHVYNPKTFPNHAHILQKYINQKAKELNSGTLFDSSQEIVKGFNLYDLKSVKKLHDLKLIIANLKNLYKKSSLTEENLKQIELNQNRFKGITNLDINSSNLESLAKIEINKALQKLQSDLNILHRKQGQIETIDGFVTINPTSVQIEPYEIVMPKIFATIFGLTTEDNVDEISKDKDFFLKRLISHLNTIPKTVNGNLLFTLALQKINGNHTYLLNSNDAVRSNNFKPKEIQKIRENGKLFRVLDNKKLYEIGENDQIWEYIDQDGNSAEVIVTDDINSYLDRIDFVTLNINTENSSELIKTIVEKLRQSTNSSIQDYIEMVDYLMKTREGELLEYAIDDIQSISLNTLSDHPLEEHFRKLGKQMHASFLKSLEVVAARIPAQSMQSFMPMKIVGFEESDINTAYVSTTQMLFQGSDYDIDAVSLASYAFNKSGRYIMHSPLANIESLETLKASQNIPFPTGETLEVLKISETENIPYLFPSGKIFEGDQTRETFDYSTLIKRINNIKLRKARDLYNTLLKKKIEYNKQLESLRKGLISQEEFNELENSGKIISEERFAKFVENGNRLLNEDLSELDYNELLKQGFAITEEQYQKESSKPFYVVSGGKVKVDNDTVESIDNLIKFIEQCNKLGYIPASIDSSMSLIVNEIVNHINRHNTYINNRNVEDFSKNYIVTSMYDIGISPANLIESQAALDSITEPLKEAASVTLKAIEQQSEHPVNFTTNIHGLVQNMDGKKGVGICAVGLKGFFAATARYNDVLNDGTPEEVARLRSNVEIARKKFHMLANAYTTNEVNQAILGSIITALDQTNDAALVLSALLSLATDNAKELALSKLNAANMLGMYIYGIAIGMDFRDISKIIASKTGIIIDSYIREDAILQERGMSMENIFDYVELGPVFKNTKQIDKKELRDTINYKYETVLNQVVLRRLAWEGQIIKSKDEVKQYALHEAINYLESQKISPPSDPTQDGYEAIIEYNRNIEKAEQYIKDIYIIKNDKTIIGGNVILYNESSGQDNKVALSQSIYGNLKKLYWGGEEMRRLGRMLHINQGNETSYSKALNYIEDIESAMADRQYLIYKEKCRELKATGKDRPTDFSSNYKINLHKFLFNENYREGVIDLYGGIINEKLFNNSDYRIPFEKIWPRDNEHGETIEAYYKRINSYVKISPSKVFINIFDVLQVPHYMEYIKSADMLDQYMTNSAKYRGIKDLGSIAIKEIGVHSSKDKENIYKKTEQFIDELIRDRFFYSLGLIYTVPKGAEYFVVIDGILKRVTSDGNARIRLGTIEGNASFKLLMEDIIIPDLQKMAKQSRHDLYENKFILSLSPTLFKANPEHSVTICRAPNINMSPRSDSDSALFEDIRHDFNNLRTISYMYPLGNINVDLIELFYYYNQIAFGGKVGENTLTNIFTDVLDYKNIKNFRDFESEIDKNGNFKLSDKEKGIEGTITLDTLIRRTAPISNKYSSNFNYFYQINPDSGELEFNERNKYRNQVVDGEEFKGEKFIGTPVDYVNDIQFRNYVNKSSDSDRKAINYKYKDGRQVRIIIEKGVLSKLIVDGIEVHLSSEDINYFKTLPQIVKLTSKGLQLDDDRNSILSKVDEIISCKI